MNEKSILTIVFQESFDDGEDVKTTCIFEEGSMGLYAVHRNMKKACVAMGFVEESIEKVFGEDIYDDF